MGATIVTVDPESYAPEVLGPAIEALRGGGVVAFPTETVYGLAARADRPEAVARLASIKGRDPQKPLSYHASSGLAALEIAGGLPPRVLPLLRRFWPGPITVVVPRVGQEGETAGLRVPAHPVAEQLLRAVEVPILGTSANLSGEDPLTSGAAVTAAFADAVDVVIDAGETTIRESSSVVKVTDLGFTVLREGIVSADMVRRHLTVRVLFVCTGNTCRSPMAEAMMKDRLSRLLGIHVGMLAAQGFEVGSAGTGAGYGGSAATHGVAIMRERGLDTSKHQSRPLTTEMVEQAGLVIPLSYSHEDAILRRWPQHAGKVLLLDPAGVPDPIGGSLEVYRECANHIDSRLGYVVDLLFGDELGKRMLALRSTQA
ncbi:MAG: L-threonylcarbamoyladenylate synthase [Planctomycetota bacterium]|jgi:tRNA threonylcarbamoyl adenosine modification protein (Sua5/YciO/YrdC/YwlC family)